jgi:hypothetical protein
MSTTNLSAGVGTGIKTAIMPNTICSSIDIRLKLTQKHYAFHFLEIEREVWEKSF